MNIIVDLIPKGRKNRPGKSNPIKSITIHNTGNERKGANAKAHSSYLKSDSAANAPVSWHYTVDNTSIYQHIPENEWAWHAADGRGPGNTESIGIEICMNSDGNIKKATDNAVKLVADICNRNNIDVKNIKQHYDRSGKNCPAKLRSGIPYTWNTFINNVSKEIKKLNNKKETEVENKTIYRVQVGAYVNPAIAEYAAERLKLDGFDTYITHFGKYIRVQVGAYSIRSNAEVMKKRLIEKGFKDAFISTADISSPSNIVPGVDIKDLANRVIKGEFGNGEERRKLLGDLYAEVQAQVNKILKKEV